ncbi:4316_t:CDS:1, partial [Funneliformis caledonium]
SRAGSQDYPTGSSSNKANLVKQAPSIPAKVETQNNDSSSSKDPILD